VADADPPTDAPLRSLHTNTLPGLLADLGVCLVVSTYQAGKLVLVRPADDGVANTHFRTFDAPMGVALDGNRLAVGTRVGVWEFHDQPPVSARLDPPHKHDRVFVPRRQLVTGHIAVHDIEYAPRGELWAVNTRFSCLCTLDPAYSFVPRWRPPFVTALSPTNRCHLNGLCLEDGKPRFVTALGTADVSGGWRETKATGGMLMDVPTGQFVCRGLSMPHSPRIYGGRLWVCESGVGSLAVVDPATGKPEVVALLPGFTRGVDFVGPYAFVGLSQVRESAVFSGIPITERLPLADRRCGVWVVDTRSGQTVAFLQFEEGVQEVFAVKAVPARWPDLLNDLSDEVIAQAYVLPDDALREVSME
jgi:uncharacterized protein (TIGR03032 family)